MRYFLYIHSKAKGLEQALGNCNGVAKRLRANDSPRQPICNAEQKMSAALVRERYAVLA